MNPWKDFERETEVRRLHFYRKSLRSAAARNFYLAHTTILGVEVRS